MTVGIDFGTSTSEIGYANANGNVTVVPNHLGEEITPSAVYIAEDGTPIVGREAKERAVIDPENAVLEVKRLFGQDHAGFTLRGKTYTPVDIAAIIIRYLINCAETHLQEYGQKIDAAVITVPAYFTDTQRKDVIAAGNAAGLSVERIINEPTAASLDYGVSHMQDCAYILVYDLGGGTLDVTVLELFEGVAEVLAGCGNNTLGGKDFDQMIIDRITAEIQKRDKIDITGDARVMMRIKNAAEQCKIALSREKEYAVELPFLYNKGGEPADYSETLTRKTFEEMINEKISGTRQQINTALSDAGLTAKDIDLTLLVGGSTRIPLVSRFLSETFGLTPKSLVDPDLAVVRGAAIQAGILSGVINENAIVLTDVCPYSLSTKTLTDIGFGMKEAYCDILIKRNTTLPVSVSKIYATSVDSQTRVHVTAYQGESMIPEENYLLNTFLLSGIPKARKGKEKISIRFEYDLNSILTVSAEVVSTGKSAAVTVDTGAMGKNLDLSAWKEAKNARKYRQIINRAGRIVKVYGNDGTEDIRSAADELKKALVLGWESDIADALKENLQSDIEIFEEDDEEEW